MSSPNLYLTRNPRRSYKQLTIDPDNELSLYASFDYITTNFNFKLSTNSFIQNADAAFFLKSRFQREFFQFLNGCYLQTEIPKSFIRTIADLKNWNLDSTEEMDELRLYMIGTGRQEQDIQKKINLATGKTCFFLNDRQNILTLFTDLDAPGEINRESQVEGDYTINFRLQMSCWLPNAFIMLINKKTLRRLNKETIDSLENPEQQDQGIQSVHFSFNTLTKKDVREFIDQSNETHIGHLLYSDIFTHYLNTPFSDIQIIPRMSEQFKKVYSYGINILNIPGDQICQVFVFTADGKQDEGKAYNVDYESLLVKINENIESDIAVALYVDRVVYESIEEAMKNDKNYFRNNFLTNIMANICGTNIKLKVKSFVNENEKTTSDIEKSLRVQTAYGIGYISLLADSEKDAYKVCIGYDGDNPIIRAIDTV